MQAMIRAAGPSSAVPWKAARLARSSSLPSSCCPQCCCCCRTSSDSSRRRRSYSTHTAASRPALLSRIYAPTSRINNNSSSSSSSSSRQAGESLKSLQYLLKAGFIRQSSAGIYSLLPLGQRVIDKLSAIIEDEMYSVGASKVTLPHLLPPDLWEQSGRWDSSGPELWRVKDRRENDMLLAPTHEEEITALVAADAPSERNLPVRLFQIGRKFRDEARPRAGLLRGREFLMKDLYTFDATEEQAAATYEEVKQAYVRIFDRIGLPYSVAEADTGNIGGSSSHEFHYTSAVGEDTLITCSSCHYVANSELAKSSAGPTAEILNELDVSAHLVDLPTENALGIVILKRDKPLNMTKIKKADPEAKQLPSLARDIDSWDSLKIFLDETCVTVDGEALMNIINRKLNGISPLTVWPSPPSYIVSDFRVAEGGEGCTNCGSKLDATSSIEVGHTFLLGTRYSRALDLTFARTHQAKQGKEYYQMGCYGIGVSRLVGSIAELLCDDKGLKWPMSVAPYQVCALVLQKSDIDSAKTLASQTGFDVVIDDRIDQSFGKRIRDAELVGYPYIAIFGRDWQDKQTIELHERSSGKKQDLSLDDFPRLHDASATA